MGKGLLRKVIAPFVVLTALAKPSFGDERIEIQKSFSFSTKMGTFISQQHDIMGVKLSGSIGWDHPPFRDDFTLSLLANNREPKYSPSILLSLQADLMGSLVIPLSFGSYHPRVYAGIGYRAGNLSDLSELPRICFLTKVGVDFPINETTQFSTDFSYNSSIPTGTPSSYRQGIDFDIGLRYYF